MSDVLRKWVMRRGDRLPLLSVVVEDDQGRPVNLSGARAFIQIRCEDGSDPITVPEGFPQPPDPVNGWLSAEAYIYDATNGVVVYDWPTAQSLGLTVMVDQMVIHAVWPDGRSVTAPSARDVELVVRPSVLPPIF